MSLSRLSPTVTGIARERFRRLPLSILVVAAGVPLIAFFWPLR